MAKETKETKETKEKTSIKDTEKSNKITAVPAQQESKKNEIIIIFSALLTAIVIFASVMGTVFYLIVHNNVNGMADKYKNTLKDIPIIRLALPEEKDPENQKNMTEEEVRKKYEELRKKNKSLLEEINTANKKIQDNGKLISELEKQKAEYEKTKINTQSEVQKEKDSIEKEKKMIEEEKKKIGELIANEDKAGLKEYFNLVDPKTAQKIYEGVVKEEKASQDTQNLIKLYEGMDPATTAQIFGQLGIEKIGLIVNILKNMKNETAAQILESMDAQLASKIIENMTGAY